jgi:TonB family protein
VVEAGAREAAYLDLVDKPLEDCEAVSFEVRGLNAFLLNRGGTSTSCGMQQSLASQKTLDAHASPSGAVVAATHSEPSSVEMAPKDVLVAPHVDPKQQQPNSQKFITARVMKQRIAGKVIVKACVGSFGELEVATIQESGGDIDLDSQAIEYAKALKYLPATRNGVPASGCFSYRVVTAFKK